MSERPLLTVLLGAQRVNPSLGAAVAEAGIRGKIAVITAGWQEREAEDDDLSAHLDGRTVNLRLHERADDVFRSDPELSAGHRERQRILSQRQDFYRVRLEHALAAEHVIQKRHAPTEALAQEEEVSLDAIRALDEWHLARSLEVQSAFEARWDLGSRPAIARHRRELAEICAGCEAVAIAGGNVATLINRLALFGVRSLVGKRAVFAWSGGAMAICERIVLFHDDPPQGPGASEVLDRGLGLAPGLVVFPQPEQRLHLDRTARIRSLVRRFAPARCLALPARARVTWSNGQPQRSDGVIELFADGHTAPLEQGVEAPA